MSSSLPNQFHKRQRPQEHDDEAAFPTSSHVDDAAIHSFKRLRVNDVNPFPPPPPPPQTITVSQAKQENPQQSTTTNPLQRNTSRRRPSQEVSTLSPPNQNASEDALQSFKRLRVHEGDYQQQQQQQQNTETQQEQSAGQDTGDVPNYSSMNRLLGILHQERLKHHHHQQQSNSKTLPSNSRLY